MTEPQILPADTDDVPQLTEAEWAVIRERVAAGARERARQAKELRRRNTHVLQNGRVVTGGDGFEHLTPAQHRAYAVRVGNEAAKRRVARATRSVTVEPRVRRAASSGRPAGRPSRTRRSSGSRGDPGDDDPGEPEPPARWRQGELRHVRHALAPFLAEVRR